MPRATKLQRKPMTTTSTAMRVVVQKPCGIPSSVVVIVAALPAVASLLVLHHREDFARGALVRLVDHLAINVHHALIRIVLESLDDLARPFDFLIGRLERGIDGIDMVRMDHRLGGKPVPPC